MEVNSDASEAETASFEQPGGMLAGVQNVLHRYPAISPAVVLLLSGIVFALLGNGRFQRPETLGIILQQTAVLAALAIGQTLIILTAGIDLAVGTAMLLTHLVVAKVAIDQGVPAFFALLAGAVVGVALGAFHGALVTKIGLPPFIVTLGTFYIFNSLGLIYSKAQTISKEELGGENSLLLWTGKQISFGSMRITTGVLLVIFMYMVFAFILANTAWGRHVYATGDDREAARLAGIDVNRVLLSVYMVAGLLYAIGGWVQLGRSLSASSNAASDINLESITAVVIGGTSLFGGRGRLWGTLIGALIVTVFRIGLNLAGVNQYYQNFAIGALILIAVTLDQWIRRVGR
ncbi:MAG TPA: ABC transporter permease [Ilumatobacteraceae bacterium]|jgi:fructose transport system permease protein|nr:ABC transporter permease [Ilumatobacteraceae bacterium]